MASSRFPLGSTPGSPSRSRGTTSRLGWALSRERARQFTRLAGFHRCSTKSIILFRSLHFGGWLRGTVIFGFGFYTCPDYLHLSAQYLQFQPAFLLGFASLVSGLPRPAYKTVEVFRGLFLHWWFEVGVFLLLGRSPTTADELCLPGGREIKGIFLTWAYFSFLFL